MTKFLRVLENAAVPPNKQAKELLDYAISIHKNEKFNQKDFTKLLKDQAHKNTALKDSKADPSLTFNYYLPALWFYGSLEKYEDETLLTPKLGSIDPYKRTSKKTSSSKPSSLKDELTMLEKRIEVDMARMEEIQDILKKAEEAANANGSAAVQPPEPEATNNQTETNVAELETSPV